MKIKSALDIVDRSKLSGIDKAVFDAIQEALEERLITEPSFTYNPDRGILIYSRFVKNKGNSVLVVRRRGRTTYCDAVYGVGAPYYANPVSLDEGTKKVLLKKKEEISFLLQEGDTHLLGFAQMNHLVLPGIAIKKRVKPEDLVRNITEINTFYSELDKAIGRYHASMSEEH